MVIVAEGDVAYTVHGKEHRIVSIGEAARAGLVLAEQVRARIEE